MSLRSDAATDRVSYTASAPPAPATAFTATFWVRLRADRDDFSTMLRLHASTGSSTTVNVTTSAGGVTPIVVSPGNTSGIVGGDTLAVDQWRMLAVTVNGTTATDGKIYTRVVGGTTKVTTGAVTGGSTPTGLTLYGRSPTDANEWFNGGLAYMRIWSAVLSQAEIEAEWASATAVRSSGLWANWPLLTDLNDISGNARHLTAGTTALTVEDNPPIEAGSGSVSGTALGPFGSLTSTASGTRATTGTAAAALGVTITASGFRATTGTGAVTLGALAGSAGGTRTVAGATAGVLGGLTGTASGTRTVTGSAASAFGSLSSSSSGPRTVTGTATLTGSALSATGTGARSVAGAAASAFGSLAASASAPAVITGTASGTFGTLTATASGSPPNNANSSPSTGSWYALTSIVSEVMDLYTEERSRVPEACPDCGEPLRPGPRGERYCPFDGSMWAAGNRRVNHFRN